MLKDVFSERNSATTTRSPSNRVSAVALRKDSRLLAQNTLVSHNVQVLLSLLMIHLAVQCFCGNTLINGATTAPDGDCNMGCGGAGTEACGGPNRLSVYTATDGVTSLPIPVIQKTNLPGHWAYQGCLK